VRASGWGGELGALGACDEDFGEGQKATAQGLGTSSERVALAVGPLVVLLHDAGGHGEPEALEQAGSVGRMGTEAFSLLCAHGSHPVE